MGLITGKCAQWVAGGLIAGYMPERQVL